MKNVLIVDDREQDIYLLRALLEGHGYTVVSASNGKDALKAAREAPPDIIISDIMMPVMDGFVLCREWMGDERLKNMPFVFYTASYTDEKDQEFALSLGAARFILKPTEPDEFMEIIQGVVRDMDEGKIKPGTPTLETDEQALKLYDERLINKLGQKMLELEKEVAERKRAEEALRNSEAKFRTLYESSSDAVMLLDKKSFLGCNPATLAIFGCATEEEFGSRHPADLSPPTQPDGTDSMTLANERIATAMKKGSLRFEWTHRRANGEDFPADVALTAMELGGRRVLQALVRDITDRKRVEEELRESRDYLKEVTSSMWDAVFSVKMPERIIEWASDSFGLLGYDSQEYIGRTPEFAYPSTSDYTAFGEILREAIADGKNVLHAEQTLKRKNGTLFPAAITTTVTRKQGEVIRVTSVVRDISERKRAEEELAEHREHLEERVRERTEELRKMVNLMAGRENRMAQLKVAVKKLRAQLEEAGMTPVIEE